jgi:site-specific recombinase XerC
VAATDPALFTYLRLAVSTGARRSQLLALRWAEIDLGRAAIAFTRALVEGADGPVLAPTKTRRSYRVTLDAESLAVLVRHRQAAEAVARQVGAELTGECFVFGPDADGRRPWLPNALTKRFIRARRDAGLTHFRLHDLRHFMATQMLAAGVPIATVSQRLSHARASTTLNVYAHAVPGGDRDAAETLSAILNEARPDASTAGCETLGAVEHEAGACPGRAQLVVPAAPGVRAGVRDAGRRFGAAAPSLLYRAGLASGRYATAVTSRKGTPTSVRSLM